MDITTIGNLTLTALFAIGATNVVTFFRPDLDSRVKFVISLVAALIAGLVPADLGVVILNHLKDAIIVAGAASGGYKLAKNAGGE